jgi:hypothetical protein
MFPNCFHISLDTPKNPLIFNGKFYTYVEQNKPINVTISACYILYMALLHTQEVVGSNPTVPTIILKAEGDRQLYQKQPAYIFSTNQDTLHLS